MNVMPIELLVERVASSGITPSAAQRQGPPKTMENAIRFLYSSEVIVAFNEADNPASFIKLLDTKTEELRLALPPGTKENGAPYGQHWGSARKFLNIFLLECTLNKYLCGYYPNLHNLEQWLEVPLDSFVGKGLSREQENKDLPVPLRWDTIIGLAKNDSDKYQVIAQKVANRMNICRVHLDLYYLRLSKAEVKQ